MSVATEKETHLMDDGNEKVAKTVEQGLLELKKETNSENKCIDLNYMVYNYGKFHNNVVN